MEWLRRLYDRRVINVNVNVVAAGLLALGITVGVMDKLEAWGTITWLDSHLPIGKEILITLITFVVDMVADVAVYYGLHWLANHMPRTTPRRLNARYADLSFIRDATLVQFERAVLSPLLYAIALGVQHWMLHRGYSVSMATAVGFTLAIAVSRVLHTIWMLHQERRAEGQAAGAMAAVGAPAAAPARPEPNPPTASGDPTIPNGNGEKNAEPPQREVLRSKAG